MSLDLSELLIRWLGLILKINYYLAAIIFGISFSICTISLILFVFFYSKINIPLEVLPYIFPLILTGIFTVVLLYLYLLVSRNLKFIISSVKRSNKFFTESNLRTLFKIGAILLFAGILALLKNIIVLNFNTVADPMYFLGLDADPLTLVLFSIVMFTFARVTKYGIHLNSKVEDGYI